MISKKFQLLSVLMLGVMGGGVMYSSSQFNNPEDIQRQSENLDKYQAALSRGGSVWQLLEINEHEVRNLSKNDRKAFIDRIFKRKWAMRLHPDKLSTEKLQEQARKLFLEYSNKKNEAIVEANSFPEIHMPRVVPEGSAQNEVRNTPEVKTSNKMHSTDLSSETGRFKELEEKFTDFKKARQDLYNMMPLYEKAYKESPEKQIIALKELQQLFDMTEQFNNMIKNVLGEIKVLRRETGFADRKDVDDDIVQDYNIHSHFAADKKEIIVSKLAAIHKSMTEV